MFKIGKDASFKGTDIPFGVLDVRYPAKKEWDEEGFRIFKDQELAKIMALAPTYDRKDVFGEDPYFRYFRKYKKTYPVMMQLESFLGEARPFPDVNPVNEVAFLAELKTRMLLGTHDIARIQGELTLFRDTRKTPFCGIGDREVHNYPGDISGRDDLGIVLSMIAGADNRTCVSQDTRHTAYFVFGVHGMEETKVQSALALLELYAKSLAPLAVVDRAIL